jgi:1-phosphofructokinase family hexose kinase
MIITVTINPAMDKVLILDQLILNETNRIRSQYKCVGGKGTHVSYNLSLLGIRNIATGIVCGNVGKEILSSLCSEHIDLQFVVLEEGNSRINYVIIDRTCGCTLLSEKGPMLEEAALQMLIQKYSDLVSTGDIVVISGDASNQARNIQDSLIDIAHLRNAKICLDTSGDNLIKGIYRAPFLIKPNLTELKYQCGRDLDSQADIIEAIDELVDIGIQIIVVSCGSAGSIAYAEGCYYEVIAPHVPFENTVGCGDALLAGILAGIEQGLDMKANLKQATAVAAAAAMNDSTVGFKPELISQLVNLVSIEKIKYCRKGDNS